MKEWMRYKKWMMKLILTTKLIILQVQILLQYFFKFKGLMHVYNDIRKCYISTEKAEEDQIKSKSSLSKVISSNPKYVKIYQSDTFRKY